MAKSKTETADSQEPSFEDSLAEVERVVRLLEGGTPDLADALTEYETAIKHLRNCQKWLTTAKQKVELLTGVTEEGEPITTPFDEHSGELEERAGTRKRARKASPKSQNSRTLPDSDESEDVDDSTQLF